MKNIKYITLSIYLTLMSNAIFSQLNSNISNNPPLTLTVTATADSICPEEPSTLTANLSGGGTYIWSPGGATTSSITVSLSTTQIFTVVATQGATHDTGEIRVVVVPLPKPAISGTSRVCRLQRDTLTVSGGAIYLWSNGGTNNYYFTGPIDADSTITVTAFNVLGCSHDTTFEIVINPLCTEGINEIQYANEFHVFPDPGNGIFTIESLVENGKSTIEIYNIIGEKIFARTIESNENKNIINISYQHSGIYFYRVLKEDGSLAGEGKLMIE